MKTITINGKEYEYDFTKLDFNGMCELEDKGFDIQKPSSLTTLRALVAYVIDCDGETAGREIMLHRKNGGEYSELAVLIEGLQESDFFRTEVAVAEQQKK